MKQKIPEPSSPSLNEPTQTPHSGYFGLLKISGPDAKKFLQGQLTCNLEEVSATESRLGAHCNPQGRVLFLFRIFYFREAYYLLLPREMVTPALNFLKKYAVFFKLSLSDASEENTEDLKKRALPEGQYFDLRLGIPQIYPETIGLFLPHDLNLHELQGLSWDKGCYTGQEIIARMQYRGKLKNHLYRAQLQSPSLPQRGKAVYSRLEEDFKACGFIVDYQELGYNLYELLVLTSEAQSSTPLKLDPQQNETWEWLK